MTKLCPRGKRAAKAKFAVYPSAYANAYASKICAGKIKDPSGKKKKDWGPKKMQSGGSSGSGASSSSGARRLLVSKKVQDHAKTHRPKMTTETKQEYNKRTEYTGSHIKSDLVGEKVSNKSYEKYYKGLI
jgi:hypothetical protein